MEANLRTSVLKRGAIKARLTRFKTYVDNISNDDELIQLKTRLTKMEGVLEEFENFQEQIEQLEADNLEEHSTERGNFEDLYFATIAQAQSHILRMTPAASASQTDTQTFRTQSDLSMQVKLPTINLPTFNGDYDQWTTFVDTFTSLIHNNNSISAIQKFHYLRSAVTHEAAQVIHSLEISSNNYEIAWDLLKERFQNKRVIVQNYIKAIFEQPSIAKESYTALRSLLDAVSKHLRALKSLGQPTESWDSLLIHIITSKFDHTTRREWESVVNSKELPSMTEMNSFLQKRCQLLHSMEESFQAPKPRSSAAETKLHAKFKPDNSRYQHQSHNFVLANNNSCVKCKSSSHSIYNCEAFINQTTQERFKDVKKLGLCINCLKGGHHSAQCSSRLCRICNKKHNTLLHFENRVETAGLVQTTPKSGTITHHTTMPENVHVLLSTAVIKVYDRYGKVQTCRALLDSGSQSNFICAKLAERLGLECQVRFTPISGVNETITPARQVTTATIQSRLNNYQASLNFLVLNTITDRLPAINLNRQKINIPSHLKLADPDFHRPASIDMLLGAEIFWDVLCAGQLRPNAQHPVLQKTQFGWVVSGRMLDSKAPSPHRSSCHFSRNDDLHKQLNRFWVQEETPAIKRFSSEELACETHFETHTTRDSSGRFRVKLPLKADPNHLGDSRSLAMIRFQHLEHKLSKNPVLKEQYAANLQDYIDKGHMKRIEITESDSGDQSVFYLPHHAVVKESSTTTKCRVVFDGSARSSSGKSLNELLMVGPTIQEDLFSIVIRFRIHRFVLTADIEKMYRQVQVHPDHINLQRILWRNDPGEPIETHQLTTVTFGTSSAPYLATRCLQEIANVEEKSFPTACNIIKRDFYIDDLLTGAETTEMLRNLKTDITHVLSKGGFRLHKWNSSIPELIDQESSLIHSTESYQLSKAAVKTLGLFWTAGSDQFTYQIQPSPSTQRCSKRRILIVIAGIFDPLGLLGPVISRAKVLLQSLWLLQIGWDEAVPLHIFTDWQRFEQDLHWINFIQIPRRVISLDQYCSLQIHGFCDASEKAYGACVYIRASSFHGHHGASLYCAKSRVAPLKTVSIPRLELCSALLLARLIHKVQNCIPIEIKDCYLWTDSTVALTWINSSPHKWKSYVANRTSEIQELTSDSKWNHVRTYDNPADLLSRGCSPQELKDKVLWWNGPQWLMEQEQHWPNVETPPALPYEAPEVRLTAATFVHCSDIDRILSRYSRLHKLVNVTAYCLRFANNCNPLKTRVVGPLCVQDRNRALRVLIKAMQSQVFIRDIQQLEKNKPIHTKSRLLTLSPFLDENNILRVGGRLQQSGLSFEQKHPILLPTNHRLTKLIIEQYHVKQLHAGPQATLAAVRLKFWPLTGHRTVKGVIRDCVTCFKSKPRPTHPEMGQLPKERVNVSRPFSICGVDFGGPFMIRDGSRKSCKKVKAYMAIFVCFATRATHIEAVSSLSTEAFLGALKRFIGRRGKPVQINSDNGTNFVGADRELKQLKELYNSTAHQQRVQSLLAEEGIQWVFIPPSAPHFGGIWEAAIKSAKHHLRRVIGDASLTFEELSTIFIQVESCLNSRPMTPMSSDPSDLAVLTPGHFLIGDALCAHNEPSLTTFPINRLSRWQRVHQLTQHFWSRWAKEYLGQLQAKQKWNRPASPISVGSLVIIKEDNTPPLRWPLGRIIQVHSGADKVIRVATVKTAAGILKRPVIKLCVLPLQN